MEMTPTVNKTMFLFRKYFYIVNSSMGIVGYNNISTGKYKIYKCRIVIVCEDATNMEDQVNLLVRNADMAELLIGNIFRRIL